MFEHRKIKKGTRCLYCGEEISGPAAVYRKVIYSGVVWFDMHPDCAEEFEADHKFGIIPPGVFLESVAEKTKQSILPN